jgi:hypothetical protein
MYLEIEYGQSKLIFIMYTCVRRIQNQLTITNHGKNHGLVLPVCTWRLNIIKHPMLIFIHYINRYMHTMSTNHGKNHSLVLPVYLEIKYN